MKLKKPKTPEEIQAYNLNLLILIAILILGIALHQYRFEQYELMGAACITAGMVFGVWWALWFRIRWNRL